MQIKTSKANREVVADLTHKLNLGKENVIARIALTYSLAKERKMDLTKIQDSNGKEYSKSVLFGEHYDIYVGLICVHYNIYKTDKSVPKYFKMHIDDGLELIADETRANSGFDGFDFLINKMEIGINDIN